MSKTAYEELPRRDSSVRLALPPRHFGHPLSSLEDAVLLIILAICSGLIFLLALALPPGERPGFLELIQWSSLGVFALTAAGAFLVLRRVKPKRELARQRQLAARSVYIDGQLLPFAVTAYGITELDDPSALLRGGLSEALLAGERVSVVILEDSDGELRLGDGAKSRLIKDGQSAGGGEALPLLLFPYSLDHHSATGSGSLHSSEDGGSFDASSGDGDGGGGDGGD